MVAQLTSSQIRDENSATKWLTAFENLLAFSSVTSAYHLQANNLDEQFNQTLKAELQRMVKDDSDTILDKILFAYCTS